MTGMRCVSEKVGEEIVVRWDKRRKFGMKRRER